MYAANVLQTAALEFAAREGATTLEEASVWMVAHADQWPESSLDWSTVRDLPTMVWSLQDADAFGNRGHVPFFRQLDEIDRIVALANGESK